ncbi:hypothetical protein D9M69_691780 [compost metagenome]
MALEAKKDTGRKAEWTLVQGSLSRSILASADRYIESLPSALRQAVYSRSHP